MTIQGPEIISGDTLFGQEVVDVFFSNYGLNDLGEIAFRAILADGTEGVYRAQQSGNDDDDIDGGAGNDYIFGGAGNDFMRGGPGADTFGIKPGDGDDQIGNFVIGEDALSLQDGLAIQSASVSDTNNDGKDDTVLVFDSGGTLTLLGTTVPSLPRMVEPDAFPEGTDLTNAFPNVTLSNETLRGAPDTGVLARDGTTTGGPTAGENIASTGELVFGRESAPPPSDNLIFWSGVPGAPTDLSAVLRADFDVPTDFVSIDAIANDDDTFELQAYDASGTLLDIFNTGSFRNDVQTMSITRPSADISHILAFGVPPEGAGPLDNLQYNAGLELLLDTGGADAIM